MHFNIIKIEEVESTNNFAQKQIENGDLHEGDVIFTLNQRKGRGYGNNTWESESGSNLLVSIIFEPRMIEASQQFVLTQLVSLSIITLVKKYIPLDICDDIKIKWPNDIYVGDKKIAGLLFQNYIKANTIQFSVVGIGVNLNQRKFISDAPNPISIIHFSNEQTDVSIFLDEFLKIIGEKYKKYAFAEHFSELKHQYLNNSYRFNSWANYSDHKGNFKGKIIDVDEYGRLIVLLQTGEQKTFMFKEIEFC